MIFRFVSNQIPQNLHYERSELLNNHMVDKLIILVYTLSFTVLLYRVTLCKAVDIEHSPYCPCCDCSYDLHEPSEASFSTL
jgi:hypothetical protein